MMSKVEGPHSAHDNICYQIAQYRDYNSLKMTQHGHKLSLYEHLYTEI
jgi:hypothetical protein